MYTRIGLFVSLLFIVAGISEAKDYKNETIECVFREYNKCYQGIASLGANFSARYDETEMQVNVTCRNELPMRDCISNILGTCNSYAGRGPVNRVIDIVHNICTKNKTEHNNFLNSSSCYNINQSRRQYCVNKYSYGSKTDAKSLCCSNKHTIECLRKEFWNACPKNYTHFQNYLVETYRSHHSTVCGYYYKYCNVAANRVASAGMLVVSFVLILAKYEFF
ncbi:uncharacterized protein CEXT_323391 [Caerostris extrusa]|uniref:Uncharacterized protein n=1 Tax=Caerostris extrusa TaxID=172846 RepID=A0AAV4SB10_CAEEX|nr:uncharacterized protein CEXT_323391 [Caerostris extrusa]